MSNVAKIPTPSAHAIMERVLVVGDLSQLTDEERHQYYMAVCESVGLNPLTRPFDYVRLDGKTVLYARKDCAEQLRRIHGVSAEILSKELTDDIYTVHVAASDKDGRRDQDIGVVVMVYPARLKDPRDGQWKAHPAAGKPLRGLERANAMMKAVTKAKRRVTLSIAGLGMLDETEVHDLQAAEKIADSKLDETVPKQAVRPPKPGERKPLPPKVGAKPVEEAGPRDKPEDKPELVVPDRDKLFADYKAALDGVSQLDKLQRAHVKANKALLDVDDDVLFEKCMAYFKERQRQLSGEAGPEEEGE